MYKLCIKSNESKRWINRLKNWYVGRGPIIIRCCIRNQRDFDSRPRTTAFLFSHETGWNVHLFEPSQFRWAKWRETFHTCSVGPIMIQWCTRNRRNLETKPGFFFILSSVMQNQKNDHFPASCSCGWVGRRKNFQEQFSIQ